MIILASDHAGYELKEYIKQIFTKEGIEFKDCGAFEYDAQDDYPDIAHPAIQEVLKDANNKGILICGSGIGMSMVANRYKGIRAALCYDIKSAKATRQHNDANILCMGQTRVNKKDAINIIFTFLTTKFEGGKHQRRIDKF